MNKKRVFSLAGTTLLAGGLLAGSIGWAAAQEPPSGGTAAHGPGHSKQQDGATDHGPGHANRQDHDDPEHQAAVAEALGLTVEELQAELEAGKTVPRVSTTRISMTRSCLSATRTAGRSRTDRCERAGHLGSPRRG
jgi:hypothetical protein